MTSSAKKLAGATSFTASTMTAWWSTGAAGPVALLELLVGLLDDDDRRVDELAHRDGDARRAT